jgi:hypothetical protein
VRTVSTTSTFVFLAVMVVATRALGSVLASRVLGAAVGSSS